MSIKTLIFITILNSFLFIFSDYISSKLRIFSKTVFLKTEVVRKTPLIGGFYILLNFNLIFFSLADFKNEFFQDHNFIILIIANLFFIIGYLDDRINLSPYWKFILFVVFSYFFMKNYDFLVIKELRFTFFTQVVYLGNFSIIFTLFSIFVFINALNMFDGVNGHSAIYFIFILSVFYLISENYIFIYLSLVILIFLIFNIKNYLFIGNSGIFFLGMFTSLIFINYYNVGLVKSSDEIVLIMFLPGLDLIRLFFVRVSNGKNPFFRDHNHWHHIISKRFGNNLTLPISATFFCLPFIISYTLEINNIYIILFSLLIYFFAIKFFSKSY